MDPVSIAASSIAFIGACRKLATGLKFLKALSRAPEEVLALTEELSDLQNVLTAIYLSTRNRRDKVCENLLAPLFSKVDRIIHELCDVCGACPHRLKEDSDHTEQIKTQLLARFRWTRAKDRIGELREQLKSIRLDFANSLATINLLDNSYITSSLQNLSIQLSDYIPSKTDPALGDPPQYEASPMRVPLTSKVEGPNAGVEGTQLHSTDVTAVRNKKFREDGLQAIQCRHSCSCVCHSVYRVKTPAMLQNLVGSLLIKSNGVYGTNRACDEFSCRRRSSASIKISYRFPEWLLNRMVSSVIMSNGLSGPQLSLAVPRIIANEADIFFHSVEGNIDQVASLFRAGLASPCDIALRFGYTPLHYAVDRGHVNLCRFLLRAGAQPAITDEGDSSVTDLAWNKICSRSIPTSYAVELEDMFSRDTWFEERQFTILHKIILDLSSSRRNLHQELSETTYNIEHADSEGRTPLSWAAELGNFPAVKTLLEHGASMSSTSATGMTPLHYAATATNSACLSMLLDHDACVDAKNKWMQSPLNLASYCQNDASYITALLDHGADINERDCYGSTALNLALFMNRDITARCLILRGANISEPDRPGFTPLNDSIEHNSHGSLSLLLDSRANIATPNVDGETLLHTTARRGDLRTVEIIQAVDLDGLDADAKNNNGHTPGDLMRQRLDASEEVQSAFRRMMGKLDPSKSNCVTFFDALEKIPSVDSKSLDFIEVRVEEVLAD